MLVWSQGLWTELESWRECAHRLSSEAMDERQPLHLASVLKSAVRLSHFSYREIERRLELHAGALSRLLNGGIELKVRHVEEICRVIGLPPGRLLRVAYPLDEGSAPGLQLEQALDRLHSGASHQPPATTSVATLDEIERCIHSALRKFFAELGKAPEPEPAADGGGTNAQEGLAESPDMRWLDDDEPGL
jgi:transcriptional regulator with XRE-family HTH domain